MLRRDRVWKTVDGGRLISHTRVRVCALTAHQWTIRPWLLMSCYLAQCRVTICSRCWRQASNSCWWRGRGKSVLKKQKGVVSLKNEWDQLDMHIHARPTTSKLRIYCLFYTVVSLPVTVATSGIISERKQMKSLFSRKQDWKFICSEQSCIIREQGKGGGEVDRDMRMHTHIYICACKRDLWTQFSQPDWLLDSVTWDNRQDVVLWPSPCV